MTKRIRAKKIRKKRRIKSRKRDISFLLLFFIIVY